MVIKWDRPNEDELARSYVAIWLDCKISSEGLPYTNRVGFGVQGINHRLKEGESLPYWITPIKTTT